MRCWITSWATNSCPAVKAHRNSTASTAQRHAESFFSAADIASSVAAQASIPGMRMAQLPPKPTSAPRMAPIAVPSTGAAATTYASSSAAPYSATAATILPVRPPSRALS